MEITIWWELYASIKMFLYKNEMLFSINIKQYLIQLLVCICV